MKSCYLCQDSLVLWVSVRAGAGLAVLRSANSGVTEEAGRALLTELPLGVVQAALEGGNISCLEICPSHQGAIYQSQQVL